MSLATFPHGAVSGHRARNGLWRELSDPRRWGERSLANNFVVRARWGYCTTRGRRMASVFMDLLWRLWNGTVLAADSMVALAFARAQPETESFPRAR